MKKTSLLIAALSIIGLASCGGTPKVDNGNTDIKGDEGNKPVLNAKISTNSDVSSYVTDMKFDEAKVLAYDLTGSIESPGTSDEWSGSSLIVTTKTLRDVSSGTGDIETMQAADSLFPGQVILANKKLLSGDPTTMNLARGKAKFYVNVPGATKSYFSTPVVNQGSVNDGIVSKLDDWLKTGNELTANAQSEIIQAYSKEQLEVELGVGIGEKLNISSSYKPSSEMNTYIVDYEQIFYTVNISMEDVDTTIFDSSVTKDQVQAKCESTGEVVPPLLITNASYGKMVYFKVETSKSYEEVAAAFKYAGSVDVDQQAKFNEEMSEANISAFVYGGSCSSAYNTLKKLGSDKAGEINSIMTKDYQISDNIKNGKLLCYNTHFLNGTQDFAEVVSTSKYIETSYKTIHQQKLYVKNEGGFEIKQCWVYGYPISGYDENGNPKFGDRKELYTNSHMAVCEDFTFNVPANYGRVEFKYDITAGQKPAYNGRVCATDFFESGDIRTCGTTYNNYVKLTFDGVYEKK